MLLTAEEARRITDRLLGMIKADDAAVGVTSQMNSNLRFAANTLQTSGRIDTVTARMTAWIDRRRGASSTTDLSWIGVRHPIAGKLGIGAWLVKTDVKDTPNEATLVGASLYYDLSKRTQAYLNLAHSSNDGASRQGVSSSVLTTPGGAMSGIVAGLAHSF